MTNINDLATEIHHTAVKNGFWEVVTPESIVTKIALIHSETSEALESYRRKEPTYYMTAEGKPEGLSIELVDVIIRVLDLLKGLGFSDIEALMVLKMSYNKTRPYKHDRLF